MVDIVASISTQMLHDLVRKENVTFWVIDLTDKVMALVLALSRIQYLLKNSHKSERVLNHKETIRDLAYRIEDVLETCAADVKLMFQKNKERCINKLLGRYFAVLNDVIALKSIRAKILDIEPEIASFYSVFPDDDDAESIRRAEEPRVVDRSLGWPRQTYPHSVEEHFVGMDEDLRKLVSMVVEGKFLNKPDVEFINGSGLCHISERCMPPLLTCHVLNTCFAEEVSVVEKQELRIISICGVQGLGKTTIARKIYNHPDVRCYFKAFAWVCLKQECQISVLLRDILRQLGSRKVKELAAEQNMIDHLKEIQSQKNCLIVLDNIWETDQWKHLSSAFDMADVGTTVLLTTREKNIADAGFSYELRLLDEDEGWELLKKHAFPQKDGPDFGMLPKLGKEMVGKCGYLPLAISSLGRNLRSKMSLSEWQMVNNDFTEYLQRDYHIEADEKLVNILDTSYDHLPYDLKQCFLYLGIFKEDDDIHVDELTFLWMAEGMVSLSSVDQATTIDTAEYNLSKLAFSGMLQVQVDEFSATRRFRSYSLHHRARELSLYEGDKVDFRLKVVDFCDGKQPVLDSSTLSDRTRRLAIHFNQHVKLEAHDLVVATDHLRSLLFLNSDQKYVEMPLQISDFGKLKLLRVLHFLRCKFDGRKLPKGIDKLINLRYLGLLFCDLDELPTSISNLRNLHVLHIRVHDNTQIAIPDVLSQMVLLKHLRLPDFSDREQTHKLILGDLLELETLFGFNCLIHDISTLPNLKSLRHLEAHAYDNDSLTSMVNFVKFYGACIRTSLFVENKCNFTSPEGFAILEEVLMCPNLHTLTLSMALIYKFPDCGTNVSSDLTKLKLMGCKIKEDPMGALGKFPNLRKLCLGHGAFVGREMVIRNGCFLNLEYLEFRSLPNLELWRVEDGAMRKLTDLTVRRCPKLEMIPDGLTSVSTLKNLELELTPNALADGREAEYHRKFDFVACVNIRKLDPLSSRNNNVN